MSQLLITILIPVKNEAASLPTLLPCLSAQTYPHDRIEVIFVLQPSTDTSEELLCCFSREADFSSVLIDRNPDSNFLSGLNQGVQHSHGTYILKWDAHGTYAPDYAAATVRRFEAGADVCGGPVEFRAAGTTKRDLLLAAEMSPFCAGGSAFRQGTASARPVRSVFHPAYRREMLARAGLWDRRMFRCEDNELHTRILRCGGSVWLDPAICSVHYIRPDFKGMLRQKYNNGIGVAAMLFLAKDCLRLFYLVPAAFVCAIFVCIALCCFGIWQPLAALAAVYFFCGIVFACKAHVSGGWQLPAMFFLLHTAYGLGTLRGIFHFLAAPHQAPQIDHLPKEETNHAADN